MEDFLVYYPQILVALPPFITVPESVGWIQSDVYTKSQLGSITPT
jgi:hypothetical protein